MRMRRSSVRSSISRPWGVLMERASAVRHAKDQILESRCELHHKQLVQPCFIPEYTSRNGRPHDIDGALAKLHGIAVIAPHQMAQRKRLLSPSQRGLDHPPDVTNFTCFGLHDN